MTRQDLPTAVRNRIVEVSPGKTPVEMGVERGGVFEFRNVFEEYPLFEIVFAEPGPPTADDVLTGSTTEPIIVHMPDADLHIDFHIIYYHHRHHRKRVEGVYRAHSCPGCGSI
jgi:hypothetical protein